MEKRDAINIVSRKSSDFSTKIEHQGKLFYIITEIHGGEPVTISTTIYLEGAHVETLKLTTPVKDENELSALVDRQHDRAVRKITEEETANKTRIAYFREIKHLVRTGCGPRALDATRKALAEFPEDPLMTSYHAYLTATVDNDYDRAVELCREAVKRLKESGATAFDFPYPLFHLNIGRAYLKANMKKDAVESFQKGLSFDPRNRDIVSELKRLGMRKRPIFPSLSRSHPLNKYPGIILTRLKLR